MAVPVHIRLPLSTIGSKSFIEKVGGYTVLTSAINYASPLQLAMKRALDIVGGLVGSLIAIVEAIHLNAFMYEPLIDVSIWSLNDIFGRTVGLGTTP